MNHIDMLRHFVATLSFRFTHALSEAPVSFGDFETGNGVRTPKEIVNHMTSVLNYVKAKLSSNERIRPEHLTWEMEISRFYETLKEIDTLLWETNHEDELLKKCLQGPLADAMTHVGQLATLSRLAGYPVPGMNYIKAGIEMGNIGG